MKVCSINNSYLHDMSVSSRPKFKGRMIQKAKRGLLPIVLAGGLLMSQPAKASSMENFYPWADTEVPSSDQAVNFFKWLAIAVGAIGCTVLIQDKISEFNDKSKNNKKDKQ